MPAITPTDLNNAKVDVDHIADVATSLELTATDRLGHEKRTLAGIDAEAEGRMDANDADALARMNAHDADALARMDVIDAAALAQRENIQDAADLVLAAAGYAVPVAYTSGLSMTLQTQTVTYSGAVYAPIQNQLPFTTSGVFESAKFRLIQGVSSTDLGASSGAGLVGWIQNATGAVFRWIRDKLRTLPADFEDFGAVGDGTTDDTAALQAAVDSSKRVIAQRGKTYKITDTLTITEKDIDFSGCTLNYRGAKNKFAMVINAASGMRSKCNVRNFVLNGNDTDTTNRTHGVNIGGGSITLDDFRIEGFTGIQLGLGSGAETYTGVTLPATSQCYYCNISNGDIAPTAGWGIVVASANNANHFRNIAMFPYNGFSEVPPRTSNCIDELVIGGNTNEFDRISLEASPSNRMALFLPTANGNFFPGVTYLERNPNWATPPYPRIELQAGSSENIMPVRHSYSGVVPILDMGTRNRVRVIAGFNVNGSQVDLPGGGANMVRNSRFENGPNFWTNSSTAGSLSYNTGYLSGKSMRVDVVAGRPNIFQDLVATGGYQIAALRDRNVTVAGWVKTNLAGLSIKCAALTQNQVPPDDAWHWFTATVKIPTAASSVSVQLITETSGLTGYAEWSDVTAVVGNDPMVLAPRELLEGSKTHDWPDLITGNTQTTTVTVTGAVQGDAVDAVSMSTALNGTWLRGEVTAADTVTVTQTNNTGGNVNVASGTLRVWVRKTS